MRAAITGHLVLSTLHTRDAISTPFRLLDMGVPPFMVSTSLQAVIAQRLVRLNCKECAEPHETSHPGAVLAGFAMLEHGMKCDTQARHGAARPAMAPATPAARVSTNFWKWMPT
jgi:type II secretory ATPase GspE/PulE/Tfp pilus assembly ATPase PilB-like protein